MMGSLLLQEKDYQDYESYISSHAYSTFEHTLLWQQMLQRHFRFSPMTIVHRDIAGKIDGVLPLFKAKSIFGTRLVSTPYAVATGILAESVDIERELLAFARDLAKRENVAFLEVREPKERMSYGTEFCTRTIVSAFSLSLSSDIDAVWSKLPKGSVRWGIKTAQKNGLTWKKGVSREDLASFYRLYLITRKQRGVPGYPFDYFREILDQFGDDAVIYTAFLKARPIASIFLLYHKQEMRYAFGGSLRQKDVLKLQPYHLLFWEAIQDACARGYTVFNLGGATTGANDGGLYEFKRKWADTITVAPSYYYFHKIQKVPEADSLLFRTASGIWKRLPLSVIDCISPYIIRQFV